MAAPSVITIAAGRGGNSYAGAVSGLKAGKTTLIGRMSSVDVGAAAAAAESNFNDDDRASQHSLDDDDDDDSVSSVSDTGSTIAPAHGQNVVASLATMSTGVERPFDEGNCLAALVTTEAKFRSLIHSSATVEQKVQDAEQLIETAGNLFDMANENISERLHEKRDTLVIMILKQIAKIKVEQKLSVLNSTFAASELTDDDDFELIDGDVDNETDRIHGEVSAFSLKLEQEIDALKKQMEMYKDLRRKAHLTIDLGTLYSIDSAKFEHVGNLTSIALRIIPKFFGLLGNVYTQEAGEMLKTFLSWILKTADKISRVKLGSCLTSLSVSVNNVALRRANSMKEKCDLIIAALNQLGGADAVFQYTILVSDFLDAFTEEMNNLNGGAKDTPSVPQQEVLEAYAAMANRTADANTGEDAAARVASGTGGGCPF